MYGGLWMFAWDLADEGVDAVMRWAADSGLDALQIAGSYHAGWFIHPHNPKHRAFMTDDGCVYFHPTARLYEKSVLKPKVARVCAESDWMRQAGERLDRFGLKLVSWTVCAHNTRLGLLHPECTVTNCFGDSYPHALCPANDHVRTYLTALCHDLANNLPLYAVQLESPGYSGLRHGHHHERDLTVLSPLEETLMDFCFCASCTRKAEAKHVEIGRVRERVRATLEAAMRSAPGRPAGHPRELADVAAGLPELAGFQAFRREIEQTLVREIKAAMQPSAAKLFLLESHDPRLVDVVDAFYVGGYGLRPTQIREAAQGAATQGHPFHVGIRLGLNSVESADELTQMVRAARIGGAAGVMFYNYSEAPLTALNWIKPALKGSAG